MNDLAVRLRFEVDGDAIRLIGRQTLQMIAPPSDLRELGPDLSERAGFWVELRNELGDRLYRRVLEDPRGFSVEAPARDGSWTRSPVEHPREVFSVLVPVLPGVATAALVGSPRGQLSRPARELVVLDLLDSR